MTSFQQQRQQQREGKKKFFLMIKYLFEFVSHMLPE